LDLTLDNINPIFLEINESNPSIIWANRLTFEKSNNYLIRSISGSGKSSLLSFLAGWRDDFEGEISHDNIATSSYSKEKWIECRKIEFAWLKQELDLIPHLTVLENLQLKNELTHHFSSEEIEKSLKELAIFNLKDKKCNTLSMGQQQRVAIIRAVIQPFKWLLIDEPFSHLDDENSKKALNFMLNAASKQNAGIILTTLNTKEEIDSFKSFDL